MKIGLTALEDMWQHINNVIMGCSLVDQPYFNIKERK